MNRPELDAGEFDLRDGKLAAGDEIPDPLIDVLKHLALDFVPETTMAAGVTNAFIDDQVSLPPGTPMERGAGMGTFEVRGVKINATVQPFRFYLLKRVQDEFEALGEQDQRAVTELLKACDMLPVLDLKLSREIGRENNLEVWL